MAYITLAKTSLISMAGFDKIQYDLS